ncbi:MAG: efflux RND transporter periplasmic adaptor subunit [Candidatus Riflebacteria bacterium]|nr:efflux RND transporter periplasmic adaptor subunit [Candidatus Riflebacteria bacterium]
MKKLTTLIIIIAAVAVSLYICKDKIWPKPKEVQHIVSKERVAKLYKIGKVSNASTMTYPGVVKSLKHAELFFRVSGPVKENNLKVGQLVKEGDVLMRIDQRDYQREIDKLRQDLKINKDQSDLNKKQFQRTEALYKQQAISKSEYDAALSKANVSDAQLKSLEESIKKAQDKLADTSLRAPFSGVITDLRIKQFEIAQANVPVMSIDDLREVEVHISVPAGNMPVMGFKDSQKVKEEVFDVTFPGRGDRVLKANVNGFKAIAEGNSETYDVALKVKTPEDFVLLPGMSAEVINVPNRKINKSDAVSIPFASVFKRGEKSLVWVFNQATKGISAREVTLGEPVSENNLQVLSGLESGEFIIGAGVDWLSEDNTIRVMNPEVLNANN